MAQPARTLVPEAEYLATMTDERPSLEFVNGEVTQRPMPKPPHQDVSLAITERFLAYRKVAGGRYAYEGTTNFSMGPDRRYRVPDCAYWAAGVPTVRDGVYLPPTLAIEIRSPGQSLRELRAKCREYRDRGVSLCWLVDAEQRWVEAFDSERDGERLPPDGVLESPLLPGFSMLVVDLWAELD